MLADMATDLDAARMLTLKARMRVTPPRRDVAGADHPRRCDGEAPGVGVGPPGGGQSDEILASSGYRRGSWSSVCSVTFAPAKSIKHVGIRA